MGETDASEERLWARVLDGDHEAFEQIVARHQSAVSAVAFSRIGDFAMSQDVAQETFLAAWKSRNELREPKRLAGWLCSIARRQASGVWRNQSRSTRSVDDSIMEGIPNHEREPVDTAMSNEETLMVWETLEKLPDDYRDALVLFYRQGESIAMVAQALDISEDAAKQRLSRGREMIRVQMAKSIEGVLVRSRPGKVFTARVMAGLAGLSIASSSVAKASASVLAAKTTATMMGVAGSTAKGAAAATLLPGILGGAAGALGGIAGGYIGTKMPALAAATMTERLFLEKFGRKMTVWAIVFTVVVFASSILPYFATNLRTLCLIVSLSATTLFVTYTIISTILVHIGAKKIRASVREADDPNDSPVRAWVKRLEDRQLEYAGRSYRSKIELLGLPLIDIQVANPVRLGQTKIPNYARGWIAIGDRADGLILAIGSIARGGIAIGNLSFGLIALGGAAIGMVSLGGLAVGMALGIGGLGIGYQAIGGAALGWDALGGGAAGWHSAAGGGAISYHAAFGGGARAVEYAVGGGVYAHSANTPEAIEVIQRDSYRWLLESSQRNQRMVIAFIVLTSILPSLLSIPMYRVFYLRRKESE